MLTVHAGLHKTGSTSIQAALGTSIGHVGRRQAYLHWSDLFRTDGVINPDGMAKIRRLSARGWHVVVSSEGALGPLSTNAVYPDAPNVAAQLDALFADQDLRLVVYVRPQHEWAESSYAQYVRSGGTLHPRDYIATLRDQPYLRHTTLVDDLRRSLRTSRLVVRPYRSNGDVVSDFFETAGLGPVPAFLGAQRANVSPPAETTAAQRQANEAGTAVVAEAAPAVGAAARSPLPEDCQADLHGLFARDWTDLSIAVADMPGHDPREFTAAVDASRDFVPRPFVATVAPSSTSSAQTSGTTPPDVHTSRTETTPGLRQRGEFLLRHGPRRALLRTLMRTG